eukprot:RCo026365
MLPKDGSAASGFWDPAQRSVRLVCWLFRAIVDEYFVPDWNADLLLPGLVELTGPRLTALNVSQNKFGDVGAQALATSSQFPSLTSLDISVKWLGAAGMQALAASSSSFPHLRSLNVGFYGFGGVWECKHW